MSTRHVPTTPRDIPEDVNVYLMDNPDSPWEALADALSDCPTEALQLPSVQKWLQETREVVHHLCNEVAEHLATNACQAWLEAHPQFRLVGRRKGDFPGEWSVEEPGKRALSNWHPTQDAAIREAMANTSED